MGADENYPEPVGGGPEGLGIILQSSHAGGIYFWGRDLGFFVRDVLEDVGSARGIPRTDDGTEGSAAEGRDLEKRDSGNVAQRSGKPDTGGVHLQVAGDSGVVGGVDSNTGYF